MKKQLFIAVFLTMAFFANAQTARIFPVIQDSVRALYMTNKVGINGLTGMMIYTQYFVYKKIADSALSETQHMVALDSTVWGTIPNLTPDTTYVFANVIIKNGVHDTSRFETFTTPQLLNLSITNIRPDTSVSPTKICFHYSFIGGYFVDVSVYVNGFSQQTSSIRLIGTGDTAILMIGHDIQGATYSNNYIYASVAGLVPGISQDSFFAFANYRVPNLVGPTLGTITVLPAQDSLVFSETLVRGSISPVTVIAVLYDSSIATSSSPITFYAYSDTSFSYHYKNLRVSSGYSISMLAFDSAGSSFQSLGTHTLAPTPPTPIIESAPQWGSLIMDDASTLEADYIYQTVISGDTVREIFAVQDITHGGTDTIHGPGNVTATETIPNVKFTGLLGGTTYQITPISVSMTGNYTLGTSMMQYTNAPQRPSFEDIIINGVTDHAVDFNVRANGEGTPTRLLVQMYQNSVLVKTFDTINTGTGYIDYHITEDSLLENTAGTINVWTISSYGSDLHLKTFTTASTGINSILSSAQKPDHVIITNFLEQELFRGTYGESQTFAKDKGFLIMFSTDKEGNITGRGVKISVQ